MRRLVLGEGGALELILTPQDAPCGSVADTCHRRSALDDHLRGEILGGGVDEHRRPQRLDLRAGVRVVESRDHEVRDGCLGLVDPRLVEAESEIIA